MTQIKSADSFTIFECHFIYSLIEKKTQNIFHVIMYAHMALTENHLQWMCAIDQSTLYKLYANTGLDHK